jgi:thiol-disulfide isomerase/thioredoxin
MKRSLSIIVLTSLLSVSACASEQVATLPKLASCTGVATFEGSDVDREIFLPCLDGKSSVDITVIKGPAIINVWGSWCDPCKKEIPYFVEFNQKRDRSITLIGVDVEEKSRITGAQFAIKHRMIWPNFYDEKNQTRGYLGMGVPVTWFINSSNKVVYKKIGPVASASELQQLAKKYLGAS